MSVSTDLTSHPAAASTQQSLEDDGSIVSQNPESSAASRLSQTHPAWTRPPDVYNVMGQALYNIAPEDMVKSSRPKSPPDRRPKPSMNQFYEGSRFYYDAPKEPQSPLCTCHQMCPEKTPNIASYKCFSCVKFDPKKKGWFCNACFNKMHPWYREQHHYVHISEDDDMEYDLVAQNYRAELDRTLDGIEGLIAGVKVRIERKIFVVAQL